MGGNKWLIFFVQGGGFMWPILIALLFGLAIIGEEPIPYQFKLRY